MSQAISKLDVREHHQLPHCYRLRHLQDYFAVLRLGGDTSSGAVRRSTFRPFIVEEADADAPKGNPMSLAF